MINAIIFSKDRAQQTRLLLESIQRNCPTLLNLNVIYTFSNEEFEKGYEKLKNEDCAKGVNFVLQSDNFKQDTLTLLDSEYEYSCFLTDDDIVYDKIEEEDIIEAMQDQKVLCFSMRMGVNTQFCYMMNGPNKLYGETYNDKGNVFKVDWKLSYLDFSYPFSVDFHVFRTKEILKLSNKVAFTNPNTYEAALQIFGDFPKNLMACYKQSKIVNTPINMVQNVFTNNRKANQFHYDVNDLNIKYLNGEIIDYDKLDFSNIIGCHQELSFNFKNV